jgi:hypothetical protein
MQPNSSTALSLPHELSVRAVLGLTDPDNGDWARLRGLQYSGLAKVVKRRIAAHVVAALAVIAIFRADINIVVLGCWLVALTGTLFYGAKFDQSLSDVDRRRMSRAEFNQHTLSSVINALIWIVPISFFAFYAGAQQRVELWTVLSLLMVVSAVMLPAMPLGTLLFNAVVGVVAAVSFLFAHQYVMSVVALLFVIVLAVGAIGNTRTFLCARVAEAGMAEKSEVVSLLLREFEEGEADWLWQIDTSRRVRAVSPRFAFALGMDPEDVDGMPFILLVAGSAW